MPTISTLTVLLDADTRKFQSGMKSTTSSQDKLKSGIKKVGAAIGLAFSAAAVVDFGKKSLEAYDTLQKNTERLNVALGKVGQGAASSGIIDWSKQFSLRTGINQADIVDMSSKLAGMGAAFFKAAGPAAAGLLEKLTGGLQDMSAATGKSASMLMRSLGPSILNTPAKATSLLVKLGVVTDAQAKKITNLANAGKGQAATQAEINAIQAKFAGTAAATATPMEKLSNLFNQAEIAAGKFLTPLIDGFIALLGWMGKNADLLKTVAIVAAAVAGPFLAIAAAMKIAEVATLLWNAALAANPIALIVIAVGVLAVVIIRNWSKIKAVTFAIWGAISRFLEGVAHSISNAFGGAIRWIRRNWSMVLAIITGPIGLAVRFVVDHFQQIKGAVTGTVNWIKSRFDAVVGFFKGLPGRLASAGAHLWDWISRGFKAALNAIIGLWNNLSFPGFSHTFDPLGRFGPAQTVTIPGFDLPNIPTLAMGGTVARTGMALVHEGERFSGVGGKWGNVTVNVYGHVMTEHDLADTLQKALLKTKRRSGALGLA